MHSWLFMRMCRAMKADEVFGAHASPLVGHVRRLLAAQQEVAPHISLNRVTHISSLPLLFLSNSQTGTELIYLIFLRQISCSGSMATTHRPSLPEQVFLPPQIY